MWVRIDRPLRSDFAAGTLGPGDRPVISLVLKATFDLRRDGGAVELARDEVGLGDQGCVLGVERVPGEQFNHLSGIIRINLVANGAEQVQPHQACIGFGDFRERH